MTEAQFLEALKMLDISPETFSSSSNDFLTPINTPHPSISQTPKAPGFQATAEEGEIEAGESEDALVTVNSEAEVKGKEKGNAVISGNLSEVAFVAPPPYLPESSSTPRGRGLVRGSEIFGAQGGMHSKEMRQERAPLSGTGFTRSQANPQAHDNQVSSSSRLQAYERYKARTAQEGANIQSQSPQITWNESSSQLRPSSNPSIDYSATIPTQRNSESLSIDYYMPVPIRGGRMGGLGSSPIPSSDPPSSDDYFHSRSSPVPRRRNRETTRIVSSPGIHSQPYGRRRPQHSSLGDEHGYRSSTQGGHGGSQGFGGRELGWNENKYRSSNHLREIVENVGRQDFPHSSSPNQHVRIYVSLWALKTFKLTLSSPPFHQVIPAVFLMDLPDQIEGTRVDVRYLQLQLLQGLGLKASGKVKIKDHCPDTRRPNRTVRSVVLRYKDPEKAEMARRLLDGRFFGGHQLKATMERSYLERSYLASVNGGS